MTGIDTETELISQGSKAAEEQGIANINFKKGSANSLPFKDETFDRVYAHQVLLHLSDPVGALCGMKRVTKTNGIICCRDANLNSIFVYSKQCEEPLRYFFLSKSKKDTTSTAGGRALKRIAIESGFLKKIITTSSSNWCVSSDEDREWFYELYADRLRVAHDEKEDTFTKSEIENTWKSWIEADDGILILVHCEILCRK
ncbi:MAG: class I SAM-dependent methyltransferase [Staphylococcus equorum]|nr:class I SAM-dependent methyltransferase [Staphylococcus equorum]MDN6749728.1 class I SAM-dependent methyltransferase [Staphylococcus equorum]